jgi:hypothetical protein
MLMVDHPSGGYRFLPGIAPYSGGVVSCPGFEIVHITLQKPVPYREGFERIAEFLSRERRPKSALCGVEIRSPAPYSIQGFKDFNADYTAILQTWDLFLDGVNPVARTNVAPVIGPPAEPVLYGFSMTRPCEAHRPSTFVVAGGGELPEGQLAREAIIALGDTSSRGVEHKARFVMDLMENRLWGLGVDWQQVTQANVYTIHSLTPLLPELLSRMGAAAVHGIHWHYARPPIVEIEFEMDLRGTRTELHL